MTDPWLLEPGTQSRGREVAEAAKGCLERFISYAVGGTDSVLNGLAREYSARIECAQLLGFTVEPTVVVYRTQEEQEEDG